MLRVKTTEKRQPLFFDGQFLSNGKWLFDIRYVESSQAEVRALVNAGQRFERKEGGRMFLNGDAHIPVIKACIERMLAKPHVPVKIADTGIKASVTCLPPDTWFRDLLCDGTPARNEEGKRLRLYDEYAEYIQDVLPDKVVLCDGGVVALDADGQVMGIAMAFEHAVGEES